LKFSRDMMKMLWFYTGLAIAGMLLMHYAVPQAAAKKINPWISGPYQERLSVEQQLALPLAEYWSMPMGSEHGALTYNAQPFRVTRHLGDDLNGIGGYNSDEGDPVWSAADGRVIHAADGGKGWGNMVIVACRTTLPGETDPQILQVLYAHLRDIHVAKGDLVHRGPAASTGRICI
jgi:murein DD-endopeptidase MepM/ murein hydrolase activator NlpD